MCSILSTTCDTERVSYIMKGQVQDFTREVRGALCIGHTVEPLYSGQIGDWPFVPCREVVPFSEVIIVSLLYHKINYEYCARKR